MVHAADNMAHGMACSIHFDRLRNWQDEFWELVKQSFVCLRRHSEMLVSLLRLLLTVRQCHSCAAAAAQ